MDIGKLQKREITEELRDAYLDYAMSVIVSRALPDVRDGLKPVHRRILYAMHELGLSPGSKFRKSAFVIGDVLGKYHPHGDVAVYDALVRLAQPFSMRYPLIQGQGNFGSLDGDSPAAMRYTETKLAAISTELLEDIDKDTVDFQPNYDASRKEPKVLPAKLPNLLINGSLGIAVGMATNIPPHNLAEVVDATLYLLKKPDASTAELCEFIKGPDFPTGGVIYDRKAIREAYTSGRGTVIIRSKVDVEERKSGWAIVITEIPYEVNKAELITKIAELAEEKRLEGIKDIRDESDKEGLRIVIDLKHDAYPERVLHNLWKLTDLERAYHFNMVALVDGLQPQLMSLKDMIGYYIEHRKVVIRRRTSFDLERTKERIHILEGLAKALEHIDEVIRMIKTADDRQDAKIKLMKKFTLTDIQSEAILEMKLAQLAKLERNTILKELSEKRIYAKELESILKSPAKVTALIAEELETLKKKYADKRRTQVHPEALGEAREEEFIPEEETIVTLSQSGYIKRMRPVEIRPQRRGGKGVKGIETKTEADVLRQVVASNTRDTLLLFSNFGRVFKLPVYEIPETSRISRGKPVQALLGLAPNEEIRAIVPMEAKKKAAYLILGTVRGIMKRTPLAEFKQISRRGVIALKIRKDDALAWAELSSGSDEIIAISALGQAIRFPETQLRPMARNASGVTAMKLRAGDMLVGMGVISEKNARMLVLTEFGFGKQSALKDYRVQRRGGIGIKTARLNEKTGKIVSAKIVTGEEELIAASRIGQTIRMPLASIRQMGRQTQGVRIMKLEPGDSIASITCL